MKVEELTLLGWLSHGSRRLAWVSAVRDIRHVDSLPDAVTVRMAEWTLSLPVETVASPPGRRALSVCALRVFAGW
jgi:hypothetical protein